MTSPLFEHPGLAIAQPRRELDSKLGEAVEAKDVAAPSHFPGVDEHVLRAELDDDVGMGADEHPGRGDLAQERVKGVARLPVVDGIHPDEGAVEAEQLIAQLLRSSPVIDGGDRLHAVRRECSEERLEAIVEWRGEATNLAVAGIDDGQSNWSTHVGASGHLIE